ncbi:MFS transporter [soil metagenome]
MFAALAEFPPFRRLWLAAVASSLGQWMQATALGWLALDLTNSESFVGLVAFCAGLPFLLISVPGGLIIDRFDRRKILIVCQALAAIVSISIAILVLTGVVRPWQLPVAAFINGSLQAILNPAQQSIVPSLVPRERLTNAIGLMGAGQNMTRVVGPTIAGAVVGFVGTGETFLLQALAVAVALGLLVRASFPSRLSTVSLNSLAALSEGFRTVMGRGDLRGLLLFACIPTLLVFPYISFLSVFARDILEIGPQGMGLLMAASGMGAVVGSLFVASRPGPQSGKQLVIQAVLYGLVILAFSASRFLPLSIALLLVAGFLGASFMSANNVLIQHRIDDNIRGRVIGIYMLTWGLMPLGAMPMGILGASIGIPSAVAIGAILAVVVIIALYLKSPDLRNL